jgi:hypothetical protein
MPDEPTLDQDLAQISRLRDELDELNAAHAAKRVELIEQIKATLDRGGPRGVITQVVAASRWTRAQIDRIRADKVKL